MNHTLFAVDEHRLAFERDGDVWLLEDDEFDTITPDPLVRGIFRGMMRDGLIVYEGTAAEWTLAVPVEGLYQIRLLEDLNPVPVASWPALVVGVLLAAWLVRSRALHA